MPGAGGGFIGGRGKQKDKKKGSKSGNPAKRAAEDAGLTLGEKPNGGSGSSFGLGQ